MCRYLKNPKSYNLKWLWIDWFREMTRQTSAQSEEQKASCLALFNASRLHEGHTAASSLNAEQIFDDKLRRARILQAMEKKLSAREKFILTLYYFKGMRDVDIAATLGLTDSRISRLKKNACRKLRGELRDVENWAA